MLHDPNGLDKAELRRLAQRRFDGLKTSAMEFDASKLSSEGFKVPVSGKDVQLPDGSVVASGRREGVVRALHMARSLWGLFDRLSVP